MGERKVVNKYYPPDFDPSQLVRVKRDKNYQEKSRIMIPFSIRCSTCGEYMGRGKKFNARKETVQGETYLGIRIFRFYFRCVRCASELTFKTDPKNMDYTMEHGGVRNYEPWKAVEAENQAEREEREAEEEGDVMKQLENKTKESKLQMDALEALDELRTLNQQRAALDPDALLAHHSTTATVDLDEEDEALVRSIRFKHGRRRDDGDGDGDGDGDSDGSSSGSGSSSEEDPGASLRKRLAVDPLSVPPTSLLAGPAVAASAAASAAPKPKGPVVVVVKKKTEAGPGPASTPASGPSAAAPTTVSGASGIAPAAAAAGAGSTGLLGMLGDYGSDDD